jgi:HTH-type transcriptional regulator, sugar sensing transcriptional regulator
MKELVARLQELGLSGREAEIYIALLQKKEITAPEVAKITSVSRTKAYEVLQNLVKKQLCNEAFRNGRKVFSGIEPKIAIQNILSIYREELEKKTKLASGFEDKLMDLFNLREDITDSMDYIEVLNDAGQIRERWLNIQENTKYELLVFVKPPYTKALDDNVEYEGTVIEKKVSIRGIYEYNDIDTLEEKERVVSIIEGYQRLGEEARIIKELPMKLVISDENITMFALKDRISLKPSITTMIVNHPSFAIALKNVFESYWQSSLTIEEYKNDNKTLEDVLFESLSHISS